MGCFNVKDKAVKDSIKKEVVIQTKTQLPLTHRTFLKCHFGGISRDYELQEIIGEGAFALVRKAYHLPTGQFRALKKIDKRGLHLQQYTEKRDLREMQILKELDHPHVLHCYEFFEDYNNFYISMEFCTGGELYDRILRFKRFTEEEASEIMSQLLSTVAYCHSKGIIHRDLKPENILVEENSQNINIKVADFGSSTILDPLGRLTGCFGSPYYVAPEVLLSSDYDNKCDLWSCGIIMYIMLTGKPPYRGNNPAQILHQVKTNPFQIQDSHPVSPQAKDLLRQLLKLSPSERISAEEALESPWVQKQKTGAADLSDTLVSLLVFNNSQKLKEAVRLFIATQILSHKDEKELRDNFRAMDKNGDGRLGSEELVTLYRTNYGEEAASYVKEIMQVLDSDSSGTIDYSEFLKACLQETKHLNKQNLVKTFNMFDKDNNGKITAEELKNMLQGEEIADEKVWTDIIKEVDKNGDGVIDIHEFLELMLNNF